MIETSLKSGKPIPAEKLFAELESRSPKIFAVTLCRYSLRLPPNNHFKKFMTSIAEDNPGKAKEFIQHLKKQYGVLAENPRMGRARPELQETLRSFPGSPYLIFYKPLKESLLIVNIIHGARDVEALF